MKFQQHIGKNIKIVREKARLTQEEVAKKAGMSSNYFAKIERGEINTTVETLYKIIRALKVKVSDIFPN